MTAVNNQDLPVAHMTLGKPLVYYCLWCKRGIEPEQMNDGEGAANVYVHDQVWHPEDATFDEDEKPQ